MTDQDIVAFVVGIVLPGAIAVILRRSWPDWVRTLVMYGTVFGVTLGTSWFLNTLDWGDQSPRAIVRAFAMMGIATHASLKLLWKPTGLSTRIEDATSPAPPDASAKRVDAAEDAARQDTSPAREPDGSGRSALVSGIQDSVVLRRAGVRLGREDADLLLSEILMLADREASRDNRA